MQTLTAADVGSTSAVSRGQLGQIGGAENPETYFVWDASDQGTNSGTSAWANVVSVGTSWGAGQSFSNALTSLLPGSNYAYRCYATNSTGEAWSDDVVTFTTVALPTVTNLGAAFAQTNAVLQGEVLDTGGDTPTVWVYHWADGGSTSVVAKGVQDGGFWVNWTGLTASTAYHYAILASNQAGTVWTSTNDFTTKAPGSSQTWYVSLTGDHSSGLSWETGFTNIQAGMDAASDGDTVMVSDGTYYTTAQLSMAKGITIRSANGAAATTVARRSGAGTFRVFTLDHADAVLDGVTVTNGYLGSNGRGAGVYLLNGTLRNSVIAENKTWGNYNGSSYGSGIYMTGGVVENCVVSNNWTGASFSYGGVGQGGGVYMTAGAVRRCAIFNNTTASSYGGNNGRGGGVYMTGGRLENSLIRDNQGPGYGGGVVLAGANARLLHCTVSDNTSYNDSGAGLRMTAGAVSNSIIYFNTRTYDQAHVNVNKTGGTMGYSCTTPLETGTGNVAAEPDFVDQSAGDYHLRPGSACLDSGAALAGITNDLDGVGRPIDGDGVGGAAPDMGAYEDPEPGSRDFACNFTVPTNDGVDYLTVVFTAQVFGPDTNGLSYWWDFTDDGNFDTNGVGLQSVTNTYGPGYHAVELVVSNVAMGVTNVVKTDYIRVLSSTNYIDVNGGHVFPYGTWAGAATTVVAAVNAAIDGGTVLVSNGTYTSSAIQFAKGVTIRGVNGASAAVIQGGDRILISHADAVFEHLTVTGTEGITMTDGTVRDCRIVTNYYYSGLGGGGIRLDNGAVYRCTIKGNTNWNSANGSSYGGGVRMGGGTVSNCTIVGNWAGAAINYGGAGNGGGVYMTGGSLLYCTIVSNDTRSSSGWEKGYGGGVRMTAGTIENCLIAKNAGPSAGGGVYMTGTGSKMLHCTVADNTTRTLDSGGLHMSAGTVSNTIVYFNTRTSDQSAANVDKSGGTFSYSCATPLETGAGNVAGEPDFTDSTSDDYHLLAGSVCIDSGTNLAGVAYDLDYTNRPLDGDGDSAAISDMGCYEAGPLSGAPFECNFSAPTNEAVDSLVVVFTAFVTGNTNGLVYWWDFENDGSDDTWGTTKRVVTNGYGTGYFSVKLTVSNEASEVNSVVKTDYVRVLGSVTYVSTNGGHVFPHASWATAASNVQDAVNATPTGGVVKVGSGTFTMPVKLTVGKAITIQSADDAAPATISGNYRIELSNAGLVLENVKVTGTQGIDMSAGTIRGCVISNNYSGSTLGGGLKMASGLAERCVIRHNRTYGNYNGSGYGGGVYMSGGTLRNCDVVGNEATANPGYGGSGFGGGVYMTGGSVESCTITGGLVNKDGGLGGGLYRTGGTVVNTIIWNNTNETTLARSDLGGAYPTGFTYSCSPDLVSGTGNITDGPLFTDPGSGHGENHVFGNYLPLQESPCWNAGTNQAWMVNDMDVAGLPRRASTVDIGAYEVPPIQGTLFILR